VRRVDDYEAPLVAGIPVFECAEHTRHDAGSARAGDKDAHLGISHNRVPLFDYLVGHGEQLRRHIDSVLRY
jgi:hypothetical protein